MAAAGIIAMENVSHAALGLQRYGKAISVQLDHYVLRWCGSCRRPSRCGVVCRVLPKVQFMQAGDARLTDTRQDEQDRCITIKSTGEEQDPCQNCTSLNSPACQWIHAITTLSLYFPFPPSNIMSSSQVRDSVLAELKTALSNV